MPIDPHEHEMVEIYRRARAGSDEVIRWCTVCGAFRIDEDYDGRTNMGDLQRPLKAREV